MAFDRGKLSYIPLVNEDEREMCEAVGVADSDELFDQIPTDVRFDGAIRIPSGLAEQDVLSLCAGIAGRNRHCEDLVTFLGAGIYDHYIPAVVEDVVSRSEFSTSYTPYQPEASQGILQATYEYQSMICALTGMDLANASLYDAGSAIGEAAIMATSITGRDRVLVSRALHPHYRQVLTTYLSGVDKQLYEVDYLDGVTDLQDISSKLDQTVACLVVQYPNFFGCIEQLEEIIYAAHSVGALCVVCADPIALGLLRSPGELGADIVVGEGQSLGIPVGFGGPLLGLFACRSDYLKHVPGRIVGMTTDVVGSRAYTLTFQTREQHIRREKATSNICTNQALVALAATAYLAALGKIGLRQVAGLCINKAHYAHDEILRLEGYHSPWKAPFFKEFVIRSSKPVHEVNERLLNNGIAGGLDLGRYYPELDRHVLFCVTERRTKEQIDQLVSIL